MVLNFYVFVNEQFKLFAIANRYQNFCVTSREIDNKFTMVTIYFISDLIKFLK